MHEAKMATYVPAGLVTPTPPTAAQDVKDVKDARAWPPEVSGRINATDLRSGDVIVVELDHDISQSQVDKVKAMIRENFPGHDVIIVVGRLRVFRPDNDAA